MYSAELYNSLPSIQQADEQFVNRHEIFSKLAPILSEHGNEFGVCVIHRHCALDEGEMMVSDGNVSRPIRDSECHPERWLANGEPYEFTRKVTRAPPPKLIEDFQRVVPDNSVLGLYYHGHSEDTDFLDVERTVGRENIVERVPAAERPHNTIATGWGVRRDGNGFFVSAICLNEDHSVWLI